MATNISESFGMLLNRNAPLQSEIGAAQQHASTIRTRLSTAYALKKWMVVGSFSRGTFIRGVSDIDVFAVVSRDDVRRGGSYVSSYTVLDNLKRELEARFRNTKVYRDVNAIVVEFSDCLVDVVPAFFKGLTSKNWPLYGMPNGDGGWMQSSPELHNDYIKRENKECGGKIESTARLLKFWRLCRSPRVPISSFYIEMVLASEGICRGVKSYAQCVTEVLQSLASRDCRALKDPKGVSGYIPCVKSDNQREAALAAVRYARDHAKAALSVAGFDLAEARRQWDIVFNGKFPW